MDRLPSELTNDLGLFKSKEMDSIGCIDGRLDKSSMQEKKNTILNPVRVVTPTQGRVLPQEQDANQFFPISFQLYNFVSTGTPQTLAGSKPLIQGLLQRWSQNLNDVLGKSGLLPHIALGPLSEQQK